MTLKALALLALRLHTSCSYLFLHRLFPSRHLLLLLLLLFRFSFSCRLAGLWMEVFGWLSSTSWHRLALWVGLLIFSSFFRAAQPRLPAFLPQYCRKSPRAQVQFQPQPSSWISNCLLLSSLVLAARQALVPWLFLALWPVIAPWSFLGPWPVIGPWRVLLLWYFWQ